MDNDCDHVCFSKNLVKRRSRGLRAVLGTETL